jgi:hypothetical protein
MHHGRDLVQDHQEEQVPAISNSKIQLNSLHGTIISIFCNLQLRSSLSRLISTGFFKHWASEHQVQQLLEHSLTFLLIV